MKKQEQAKTPTDETPEVVKTEDEAVEVLSPTEEEPLSPPEEEDLRLKYIRLAADFDNFRKRQAMMRGQVRADSYRSLLSTLLPPIDDLHRAAEHDTEDIATFRKGIQAVIAKLDESLAGLGVERMKPLGKPFDPNLYDCMAIQPSEEAEPNTVINVFADGYRMGEVILRPAQVIVAQAPPAEEADENEQGERDE